MWGESTQELAQHDKKHDTLELALPSMIASVVRGQQTLVEKQFTNSADRLNDIKVEVTENWNNIQKLSADHKGLTTHLIKTEGKLQKAVNFKQP